MCPKDDSCSSAPTGRGFFALVEAEGAAPLVDNYGLVRFAIGGDDIDVGPIAESRMKGMRAIRSAGFRRGCILENKRGGFAGVCIALFGSWVPLCREAVGVPLEMAMRMRSADRLPSRTSSCVQITQHPRRSRCSADRRIRHTN
jgi:hypothetical protein